MSIKIAGAVSLCLILFTSGVLAHGGGGGTTSQNNPPQVSHQKSDTQVALDNYREGLGNLETASSLEQKAGRSGSERKAAKHLKKANKQYGRAKRKFAKAIEHEPELYQAHSRMGYARHQTGDYEGALKSYDIALRLKPRNVQIIGDRALSHLALGRLAEVQSAHELLQKLDRNAATDLRDKMLAWQKTSDGEKLLSGEASLAQFDR